MNETKLYGVSSGDGNNGVSHMFPDYYCWTNDPWRATTLALIDKFKPEYMKKVLDAHLLDGDETYCMYATLYEPPDSDGSEEWDYACMIVEVFPLGNEEPRDGTPIHDNLESCFTNEALELVP